MSDKKIEFGCKKGNEGPINQDNMFIIIENKVKFMGVFDGHGLNGNKMSSFAMSAMVDYIQNSKRFTEQDIESMSD